MKRPSCPERALRWLGDRLPERDVLAAFFAGALTAGAGFALVVWHATGSAGE